MKVPVHKTFIPKEANSIATQFDNIANELSLLASNVDGVIRSLNISWAGNSKNKFMADFGQESHNLRGIAEYCKQCSGKVRTMQVTTVEWKEIANPWQE